MDLELGKLMWLLVIGVGIWVQWEKKKKIQKAKDDRMELLKTNPQAFDRMVADEERQSGRKAEIHRVVGSVAAPLVGAAIKKFMTKR